MTLREVLLRKGIRFHNAPNNHISLCCLFCVEMGETVDERFRLSINLSTGGSYCFNCGWRRRNGFGALLRKLQMPVAVEGEVADTPAQQEVVLELPRDYQPLHKPVCDLDRTALRYVMNRGLTLAQVARNKVGVSFIGRWAYRVLFPVRANDELVGIVGRDFTGNQEPRYLNSFGQKSLYNLPTAAKACRVVLSEGVFKAMRIERLRTGFCSMALLGKDITEAQVEQIRNLGCKEVVIWPDPDRPGRAGAVRVADKLTEAGFIVGVVWPVYQAADEQPLETMEQTWQNIEGFSWGLRRKLIANAV